MFARLRRRQFIQRFLGGLASLPFLSWLLSHVGCGGTTATISVLFEASSTGHTHQTTITDTTSAGTGTTGSFTDGHSHTFVLTADEVVNIKNGSTVTPATGVTGGHTPNHLTIVKVS